MQERAESSGPEPPAGADGDEIAAWVAKVQAAAENGESPKRARLRIIEVGADPEVADHIVSRVYGDENRQLPLAERHRVAAAAEHGGYGWAGWIGLLLVVNFLSWVFDWPFWIY